MRVAAISDSALVPERVVVLNWTLVDEIIERMTDPADLAQLPDMAALMARLLVPRDFRVLVGDGARLIFEVDRDTARIHWEMLGKVGDDATSAVPVALDAPVARQLRTSYSPPPSRAVLPGRRCAHWWSATPGIPSAA